MISGKGAAHDRVGWLGDAQAHTAGGQRAVARLGEASTRATQPARVVAPEGARPFYSPSERPGAARHTARRGAGRARPPTAGHSGILPRAHRGPRGRDSAGTRLLGVILSYSCVRTLPACAARLGLSRPVALRARASLVPTVGQGRRSGGRAATRQSARRCAAAQGQHQRNAHRRGGGGGGGARLICTSRMSGGLWWPAAQGGTVRPAHQRNGRCVSLSYGLAQGRAEEGPWGGPSSSFAREGGPPLGSAGQGREEGPERFTGAARSDVSVHSIL